MATTTTPPPTVLDLDVPTWAVAGGSLVVGFGVADLTGVRPLGGVVLFLAALWCGLVWRRERGLPVAVGLVAVYLAGFALSHRLGDLLTAWPAVLVVAGTVAFAVWAVIDRRRT